MEPGPPPSVRREAWDRTGIGVLELSSELWRIARCELPSKPRVYNMTVSYHCNASGLEERYSKSVVSNYTRTSKSAHFHTVFLESMF